jgi:biopolymer transport protein ExbD
MNRKNLFKSRNDLGEDNSETINMTPLIDMVFILLIFFLVTSSFIRESAVAVQRPKAATAMTQTNTELIVTISMDEQIWLNNTAVDIRFLRAQIEQQGLAGPNRSAIILADTKTSTGLLINVMDQLRLAGLVNISVAASTLTDPG